ncbi:MAG: class I SAM-dependent methyltransferase [Lewinellaceae bacterium]|nr:class I SAM-dependent methyltransferase [Lewinellaceae bacterium]
MIRLIYFATAFIIATGLGACRNDSPSANSHQTPGMAREAPRPTTVASERPVPKAGAGNFENLVADYESKDRVIWQKPGMVIALLGDLKGKTVADIGAGTGYFTFRLVPLADKVIGVDIDPRFITFMDSVKVRLPAQYRDRFESRLAKPEDPMLAPEEADAALIVNTYGYIENRVQYLQALAQGMKSGATLLIIDFKKNNLPIGPPDEYKVALSQVEKELSAGGFEVVQIDKESLDYQYIILAKKK